MICNSNDLYERQKKKERKKKEKRDILNKKTIMIDSGISSNIGLILFHLVFLLAGIIVIYAAINKAANVPIMVFGIIFGIVMCLIPIIISYKVIKTAIKVLNGKYIIIEDELMDKYYYQDHSYHGKGIDHSCWKLNFKYYFKDKYIKYKDLHEGDKYQIGGEVLFVFFERRRNSLYI